MTEIVRFVKQDEIPQLADIWNRTGLPAHEIVNPIIGYFREDKLLGFVARRPYKRVILEPLLVDPEVKNPQHIIMKLALAFSQAVGDTFYFRIDVNRFPKYIKLFDRVPFVNVLGEAEGYQWFRV